MTTTPYGNITITSTPITTTTYSTNTTTWGTSGITGTYTITDPSISWYGTNTNTNEYWPANHGKISASDLTLDGINVKETLLALMKRLAILDSPDPKKLEKFEALKKAYEHYKTLEALCYDEESDNKNNG